MDEFYKIFIEEIFVDCNVRKYIRLIFPEKILTRRKLRPHFLGVEFWQESDRKQFTQHFATGQANGGRGRRGAKGEERNSYISDYFA